MPGIVGWLAPEGALADRRRVAAMLQPTLEDARLSSGVEVFPELGLALGWSSHPGSFADCLPIWNEAQDIALVCTGDFAMDSEVLSSLRSAGHQFAADDASCLVHLYEMYGPAFAERLPAWFSGVVVDRRKQEALLFNDRYGLSRIYLHESAEGLWFASEAKSILSVAPATREVDWRGLAEVVRCGCSLQQRSLFRGVSLLPGGSAWRLRRGQILDKGTYFDRTQWEQQSPLTEQGYEEALEATFRRVLPRALGGRQRLGVSLTGGLDSRMVMAWAGFPPQSVECYTFAGSYRECADVQLGRRVAQACQQGHRLIPVGESFLKEFPSLAERTVWLSDGTMDINGSVELYVNRLARAIAPVRVTGNYGSEVLRSNVAFRPSKTISDYFDPSFTAQIREAAETYHQEATIDPLSFILFKQVPWHHYSRLSVEQSQLSLRTPFLEPELAALVYRAPASLRKALGPSLRLIAKGSEALTRFDTDRGVSWHPTPGLSRIKNLFQEFTVRTEYVYDYGMPPAFCTFDYWTRPLHLERWFLGRHKFYHFRVWYRDVLAGYLRDVLLSERALSRGLWNRTRVEAIVREHTSGKQNHTLEIHRLLTTELMFRQLFERSWSFPNVPALQPA